MTPSVINVAMWIGGDGLNNLFVAIAAMVVSAIVSFIATLLIGFEDPTSDEVEEGADYQL